jgi:hypothetical protein
VSDAHIERFCDAYAWDPDVRGHVGELLRALHGAAERNGEAAVRYWRLASAEMDRPLRPLLPGESAVDVSLDKFLLVLSLASDWKTRHGRAETRAALN